MRWREIEDLRSPRRVLQRAPRSACAVVEPGPRQPGRVVLRNLTDRTWTVVPDGEEPKRVAPNQRLGVRPMRIDFGPARGQIL